EVWSRHERTGQVNPKHPLAHCPEEGLGLLGRFRFCRDRAGSWRRRAVFLHRRLCLSRESRAFLRPLPYPPRQTLASGSTVQQHAAMRTPPDRLFLTLRHSGGQRCCRQADTIRNASRLKTINKTTSIARRPVEGALSAGGGAAASPVSFGEEV